MYDSVAGVGVADACHKWFHSGKTPAELHIEWRMLRNNWKIAKPKLKFGVGKKVKFGEIKKKKLDKVLPTKSKVNPK